MRANVGSIDRWVRLVIGLILVVIPFVPALGFSANAVIQWGSVVVGLVLAATALLRFCPLYSLFGLSTCKVSD